jgi:hypothetical protein
MEKMLGGLNLKPGQDYRDFDSLTKFMADVIAGEIPLAQENRAWNAKMMLQHADSTGQLIYNTRWTLLEALPETAFVTSDNPVSLFDPSVQTASPEGFKPGRDFQFTIPVSPRFMLIGERQPAPDRRMMVRPEDVNRANAVHMERAEEVYASFESSELQAEFEKVVKERPPSIRELPQDYLTAIIQHALRRTRPER